MTEAVARVDGQIPATLGRPACAVVPQVVNYGSSASLGCCGARAYLKTLDDGKTIWALKGNQLKAYVEQIETLAKANNVLTQFHEMRMGDIANGQSPTVEQSLGRLG